MSHLPLHCTALPHSNELSPRYDHGLKDGDIIQGPYFPQVKALSAVQCSAVQCSAVQCPYFPQVKALSLSPLHCTALHR
jgi:hypothetical protein